MSPPALRFTPEEAAAAAEAWGFNCGPAALSALLGKTPDELRPHLLDFEAKRFMNPTMVLAVLRGMGVPVERAYQCSEPPAGAVRYPEHGLVRLQWGGPWCGGGVPFAARYRHTHWIAVAGADEQRKAYDVNVGRWISWATWLVKVAPVLARRCSKRASGLWWPTHCYQMQVPACDEEAR